MALEITRRTPSSKLRYLAAEVEKEWTVARQLAVAAMLRSLAEELNESLGSWAEET